MLTDTSLEKARTLMELRRFPEATRQLETLLATEPEHGEAQALLTACLLETKDYRRADEAANRLLALWPDDDLAHYYKALSLSHLDQSAAAEAALRRAIELDPYVAGYFGLMAAFEADKAAWPKALEWADEGLSIDPENSTCLNLRTQALTKLGRLDEMHTNIADTLSAHPDDAFTHANAGWSLLERAQADQARTHFAEALRLNPDFEYARSGMVEAMKARNPIYRLFLNYQFWLARHTGAVQWTVVILFVLGRRVVRVLAQDFPVLWVLYGLLVFVAYLSWIIEPVGNLFLRFDRLGRHALNEAETRAANLAAVGLGGGLVFAVAGLLTGITDWYLVALYCLTVVIPLTRAVGAGAKPLVRYFAWGLAGLGALAVAVLLVDAAAAASLGLAYLVGLAVFSWVANYAVMKR